MRTTITQDGAGYVTLRRLDPVTNRVEERIFSVPNRDGLSYVREPFGCDGRTVQTCERLSHSGETLLASRASLLYVIRREHKRKIAADRRDDRR